MAITIQSDQLYNNLVLDTFNNKANLDTNLAALRTKALEIGLADYDTIDERMMMGSITEDEFAIVAVKQLIQNAGYVQVLGQITSYPMGWTTYDQFYGTSNWLRNCGMSDLTVERNGSGYWYTNPVTTMAVPNTTLKAEVLAQIEENNRLETSYHFTEFDQEYLDIQSASSETYKLTSDIRSQSLTAKSLGDIKIRLGLQNENTVAKMIQWLKDSGFEGANVVTIDYAKYIKLV